MTTADWLAGLDPFADPWPVERLASPWVIGTRDADWIWQVAREAEWRIIAELDRRFAVIALDLGLATIR